MAPAYDIVVVFFMALRVGGRSRATAGAGAASVAAGAAGGAAAAAATSRSRFETPSRPASEFVRRVCVLVSGGDTIINSTIVDTKFSTKIPFVLETWGSSLLIDIDQRRTLLAVRADALYR